MPNTTNQDDDREPHPWWDLFWTILLIVSVIAVLIYGFSEFLSWFV